MPVNIHPFTKGKTRQAWIAMLSLMWSGDIKRVCVFVPPNLISSWYCEAMEIFQGYDRLKCDIIKFDSKVEPYKRNQTLRKTRNKGGNLLVIASNCLVHVDHDYKKISPIKNPLFPTGKESGLNWDWVVIDEVSYCY